MNPEPVVAGTHPRGVLAEVALVALLSLILWWPALIGSRTLVHGDAVVHGWPLTTMLARGLRGDGALLWSAGIYGGHPIFAEGQGGFAHPLNLGLALLATPLLGSPRSMVLLHLIDMIVAGLGMSLLARRLGLGRAAGCCAALAWVFSPAMLLAQDNITIGGSLAFVPLTLWALEAWIAAPGRRCATWLAVSLALVLLAGYPQTVHALLLYLAATLLPSLAHAPTRRAWRNDLLLRLGSLGWAVLLCLGLTAIQWLPQIELARLSARRHGIALLAPLPWHDVLGSEVLGDLSGAGPAARIVPGVGSLLVCLLFWLMALMILRRPLDPRISPRLVGHLLAAVLLTLLAMTDTPLFTLLHDGGWLPGLRLFRTTSLYAMVGAAGVALLAGAALDRLRDVPRLLWVAAALACCTMLLLAGASPITPTSLTTSGLAALATFVLATLLCRWRSRHLPNAMLLLLLAEIALLRLHPFTFGPRVWLEPPQSAQMIRAMPGWQEYRSLDHTHVGMYGLLSPHDPRVGWAMPQATDALVAMTNLEWHIPSMSGALALALQRHELAWPVLQDEVAGRGSVPPGSRLIDLLAIRFITLDDPPAAPGLVPRRDAGPHRSWLVENTDARPRLQGFAAAETVAGPEAALARLRTLTAPALVIEDPRHRAPADAPGMTIPRIEILSASDTLYRLRVSSDGPGWVALTDTDYPGWHAAIDGHPVPIFPAQIMAKAVRVPPGTHTLTIRFSPMTVWIGLIVSVASLLVLVGGSLGRRQFFTFRPSVSGANRPPTTGRAVKLLYALFGS